MRDVDFIPALLFGAFVGLIMGLIVRQPDSWLALPSSLTIPATTIGVGWWINTALRHRAELDRVAIDYLSGVNRRINELIAESLRELEPERLLPALRQLGDEVYWLLGILEKVRPDLHQRLRVGVWESFLGLKRHLTDDRDGVRASTAGRDLRFAVLNVHLRLCGHLLRRPRDMEGLQG